MFGRGLSLRVRDGWKCVISLVLITFSLPSQAFGSNGRTDAICMIKLFQVVSFTYEFVILQGINAVGSAGIEESQSMVKETQQWVRQMQSGQSSFQ